jgi:hypothetical protein
VPRRNRTNTRPSLVRLADNPQLLFHAPSAATFTPADDLHHTLRHRLRLDLTVRLKVAASTPSRPQCKAAVTGRIRRSFMRRHHALDWTATKAYTSNSFCVFRVFCGSIFFTYCPHNLANSSK